MCKTMLLVVAILCGLAAAVGPASADVSDDSFGFSSDTAGSSESYLGVDTRDITPDRLAPLQLKEERGVEVTMVDQDAPAGKSGIKEHDVIMSVNGSTVESVEQLRRIIHEIPPGRMISVGISRNGQPITIKTQLAARNKGVAAAWPHGESFKFTMPAMPAMPTMPTMPTMPEMDIPVSIVVVHSSSRSGLMVENLTPQLGDYFGAKQGQGILVRSVEKGSHAETAGFRAGDVIIRVNGEKISDSGDFAHALNLRKDNSASVTVLRDRKEVTLTLNLPEHGPSGQMYNESFIGPDLDAQARMQLVRVRCELARLQPQIQREMQLHATEIQRAEREIQMRTAEIERMKPEIDRANREAHERLKHLERELNQRTLELQKRILEKLPGDADI